MLTDPMIIYLTSDRSVNGCDISGDIVFHVCNSWSLKICAV